MGKWIVYSKDGRTERCALRQVSYSGTFMGDRSVTATINNPFEVDFEVFDYIEYRGEIFELEAVPTVKKVSSFGYEYELRFVSRKYELERCEMRDIVPNDNGIVYPTPLTFSFTGDVRYLAERIQACLDDLYGVGVWNISVADCVKSEEKNITIAQQNCWNALSLVNTTYELNFYVKGRNVAIGGDQPVVSHSFEYGKGNGLYEIERASDSEIGIITKLRAFGSERNLDYSYPKKPEWADSVLDVSFAFSPLRLMLPSFKKDGKTDYILADKETIEKYGIREASVVYDDIYPSIAGAKNSKGQAIDEIKAVEPVDDESSLFVIHLHDLGFDLESHLTTSDPQISMKSGAMQGYTFNMKAIDKQNDNSYKITLERITTDSSNTGNYNIPNSKWNMKAGDKFVLLNILMPQSYIREAENRLLERAQEYLTEYGKTNFSYNIGLHDKFLAENPSIYSGLIEGAKLSVLDEEIGINESVTIQSITIDENSEENILPQVKVTLNNKPSASTLDRIQGQLKELSDSSAGNFSTQSELLQQYRKKLDKPFFDRLFAAVDESGKEIPSTDLSTPIAYIKAKFHLASLGGFTMYADDRTLNIPSLAQGLPFDGRTIWYNPDTQQIEVIGGTGGGSGEGVSNFWDLSGIPSWITNSKPKYTYSEIEGTPDLTKYALVSQIPSLSGYATESWVTKQNYATKATTLSGYGITDAYTKTNVDDLLKACVTLTGTQTITGEKNFTGGLKVNGSPIAYDAANKYWKLEGDLLVTGGVTMYGNEGTYTPSTIMDAISVDGTTISKEGGVLKVIGETGGGLDITALQNYLTQNSYLNVTSGDNRYLKLSGGTLQDGSKRDLLTLNTTDVSGPLLKLSVSNTNRVVLGAAPSTNYGAFWTYVDGNIALLLGHDGKPYFSTDIDNFRTKYELLHSNNFSSYALPLSGGELSNSATGLFINRTTASTNPHITFRSQGVAIGDIGVSPKGYPLFYNYNTSSWGQIALITNNVASATKLQTARTIWGQNFDGTGNVSGSIQLNEGELLMSSSNQWGSSSWRLYSYGPTVQLRYGDYNSTPTNISVKFNNDGSINVNSIITYEGVNSRYSIFDANGLGCFTTSAGGYAVGVSINAYDGSFSYPIINAYGSGSTLNYIFIGGAYNNPWVKIDTSANMLVKGGITMYSTSDKRLKKNIRKFNASEDLMKLGGVYKFEYNNDEIERNPLYNGTHIGLIYQNVKQTSLAKMCYEREDGYGALNYLDTSFISLLAGVGIEHETRIQRLERENKELRTEIERLKSA